MSTQGLGRTLPSQTDADTGKVLTVTGTGTGPDDGVGFEFVGDGAFEPAVPSDWDGPPTTLQEALDELAARLRIVEP